MTSSLKGWLGYLLLAAGAVLLLRQRTATAASADGTGVAGELGAAGGGLPVSIGQLGSNLYQSNSLGDAVQGLVQGIWDNGGEGYGGHLSIKTPDGTLKYSPPNNTLPVLESRIGKRLWDP